MKDKNLAAVLAFFGGAFGLHRFYLGQIALAFIYFIPVLGVVLGIIDAITLLSMDQEQFDRKYNQEQYQTIRRGQERSSSYSPPRNDRERRFQERQRERAERERARQQSRNARQRANIPEREFTSPAPTHSRTAPHRQPAQDRPTPGAAERKAGLRYFRDFEYDRAIIAFQRAIELNPRDVASHFNLAASYSCEEQADKAFYHLDRAVAMGFEDFDRIRTHDSFAFLRVQPGYEVFAENGFRVSADMPVVEDTLDEPIAEEEMVELPEIDDDLLDQLQRLATLKEKGLLTEVEFATQKKRLLG